MKPSKYQKSHARFFATAFALLMLVVLLFPFTGCASQAFAQTPTPKPTPANTSGVKLEVKAGFDGYFKVQEWVPVQVTITFDKPGAENISGRIEASTSNFDRNSSIYTHAVQLTPPSRKTFWLYIMGHELGYSLQVRLVRDDGTLIAQNSSTLNLLTQNAFVMGVVSEDSQDLSYLNRTLLGLPAGNYSSFLNNPYNAIPSSKSNSPRGSNPEVTVVHFSPGDLPPSGAGLSALDGLVVADLNTNSFAGNSFDKAALANVMASWVSQGKALIVVGDSGLRYADMLHNLLPVQDDGGPLTSTDLSSLQKSSHALTAPDVNNNGVGVSTAKVKLVKNVAGTTVLTQDAQGLPLIVRRPFGLGLVWFIAPEAKAFENWRDAPSFWNWLLSDYQVHLSYGSMARHSSNNYYGIDDLLPIAQRDDLPNPLSLGLFLVIYILIVGPINYFVLRRFDRRELAWLTIPLLTVIFSVGAFLVGNNNGVSDLVATRVTVLTVGQGSDGNFSGSSTELASIYSNGRNRFKLQVEPDILTNSIFSDEYEYTNSGYRSYQTTDQIQQGAGGGYPNLNIGTRGSRNYFFEGDNADKLVGKGLIAQISLNGNSITGTVENRTALAWNDVSVFSGRRVVKLGNINPGQKVSLGQLSSSGTSLINQLTGFNTTGNTGNGYRYYYNPNPNPKQVDITRQKATLLETLFGDNGEGLKNNGDYFYLTAWSNNSKAPFQPENRTQTSSNLTLLFEPLPTN